MADRPYHHGDLPSSLLDAAEALIRLSGLDGWSLREASVRVGVSPSAAYHHFASRDALIGALADRVLARLGERLSRAVGRASGDAYARLIAFGRSYVRWAVDDPAVARLAFGSGRSKPDVPLYVHPHDVLAAELDRLVNAEDLPATARPGADFVLWAAIHGLAILLLDGLVRLDSRRDVDHEVERLIRAVLNGLAQESTCAPVWPTARSPYTERRAKTQQLAPNPMPARGESSARRGTELSTRI